MALTYNRVILAGRVSTDITVRVTPNGKQVASFLLAVPPATKVEGKPWMSIEVTCWEKTAEFVNQYFQKGNYLMVEGELNLNEWEDGDSGKKNRKHSINAQKAFFTESKGSGDAAPAPKATAKSDEGFSDDVPF